MQRFLNLFIFTDALQVSGASSAHHQERGEPPEACRASFRNK